MWDIRLRIVALQGSRDSETTALSNRSDPSRALIALWEAFEPEEKHNQSFNLCFEAHSLRHWFVVIWRLAPRFGLDGARARRKVCGSQFELCRWGGP